MRSFAAGILVAVSIALVAQEQLPRFRSGANLVTVDAYLSKDGKPVTDLRADELEIFEDNRPQSLENFRMVSAARQGSTRAKADPRSVAEVQSAAADPEARLFVVFFDTWHVSSDGALKAGPPLSEFLNRVVGADDLVGVTTPDIPARTLTLTRRTEGIERAVRDTTTWGQRDRIDTIDPREREIDLCYPDNDLRRPMFRGVAKEMIERRREQKTLRALDELIAHLGTLRDERKFVVLLTEGWVLFRQNDQLAAILEPDSIPSLPRAGTAGERVSGATARPEVYDRGFASCERERSMLAFVDHSVEIRQLAQRANRANVTFYAVDPRGLAAFDDSIGPMRPALPEQDRTRLATRQGGLRELAGNTDGTVVLNTNDVKGGVTRITADLGSYYLMQYYSTNPKLDGRFRSITVKVKRPGVQVRARPGYLGPTEAEARAWGLSTTAGALPAGVTPIARRIPVTALRRGPSTGLKYVRAEEPRFRRNERIRVEVAVPAGAATATGRVLTTQQQATPLVVSYSTAQVNGQTIGIGEVILAPLAVGNYVLELIFDVNGQKERASYDFRIVP